MSSAGSDACRLLLSLSLSIDSEGVALVFLESEQNTVASYWRILLSQDCFTALCIGLYHFANSFSTSEPRFPTVFDRKCKKRAAAGGIAFLHSLLCPLCPSLLHSAENVRSVLCESPRYTVSAVSVAAVRLAIVFAIAAEDARVLQLFCKTLTLLTIRLILDTKASERVVG